MDNLTAIAAQDRDAEIYFRRYEKLDAAAINKPLLRHLPATPLTVLDVGAGSGRDGAYLQGLGHDVTVVEPAAGMLALGQARYPKLHWRQDSLPDLASVGGQYDLVCCNKVLMFLSPPERRQSLDRLLAATTANGLLYIILRLGPSDDDRPRSDVSESELAPLMRHAALLEREAEPDPSGRAGVHYAKFLYRKNAL